MPTEATADPPPQAQQMQVDAPQDAPPRTNTSDDQLQAILTGTAAASWMSQQMRQQPRTPMHGPVPSPNVPQSVHTLMQLAQPSASDPSLESGRQLPETSVSAPPLQSGFGGLFQNRHPFNLNIPPAGLGEAAGSGRELPETPAVQNAPAGMADLSNLQASIMLRAAVRAARQPNQEAAAEPEAAGQQTEMPVPVATPDPPMPVIFDGDNRTCTICIQEFIGGQRVVRLMCRHVFHGDCWTRFMMSENTSPTIECPNCRGSGVLIAMWDYIDPLEITQPGAINLLSHMQSGRDTEPHSPTVAESRFSTPNSNMSMVVGMSEAMTYEGLTDDATTAAAIRPPWLGDAELPHWVVLPNTWQDASEWVPGAHSSSSGAFHVETRLPGNRPALIIDPGSVGNLGGDEWARSVATAARAVGLRPREQTRQRPLEVKGVGNGSQRCTHNCVLPIALNQVNGCSRLGTFEAPIVGNSTLPGLLGLESLCHSRAVLDMVNMQLHLLGPADWRPELPPGTETYELVRAPSGHLALPCSEFAESRKKPPTDNARHIALAATSSEVGQAVSGRELPETTAPTTPTVTASGRELSETAVTFSDHPTTHTYPTSQL